MSDLTAIRSLIDGLSHDLSMDLPGVTVPVPTPVPTTSPVPSPHQHQYLSNAQRVREVAEARENLTAVEGELPAGISSRKTISMDALVRLHSAREVDDRGVLVQATPAVSVRPNGRWEIVRTGERERIEWPLRLAVARRDDFTCRWCHRDMGGAFELDHIIPWSAGGSDHGENLRVLCQPCNQQRSNYEDGSESRGATPVTWWCVDCWPDPNTWKLRLVAPSGHDPNISRTHAEPLLKAFCAHCRHLSWTDMTIRPYPRHDDRASQDQIAAVRAVIDPTTNPLKTTKES